MTLRAQPTHLIALAALGIAMVAGVSSMPAVHAAASKPTGPAPTSQASQRAAATRALQRVFRVSGPLPFMRAPGRSVRRGGGVTIELSGNWSGYADNDSTGLTYSAVSATWLEPKVSCAAAEDALA